jgi:hypothetical protein
MAGPNAMRSNKDPPGTVFDGDRTRTACMARYIMATFFVIGIVGSSAFMQAMVSLSPVG